MSRNIVFLNNLESRTLAAIRDALLPKVLSGEIRVDERLLKEKEEAKSISQ